MENISIEIGDEVFPLRNEYGSLPEGIFWGIKQLYTPYDVISYSVKSGDCIIAFSDGLVEEKNREGELLRIDGLERILKKLNREMDSQSIIDQILEEFNEYGGNKEKLNDDLTIIVLKRK